MKVIIRKTYADNQFKQYEKSLNRRMEVPSCGAVEGAAAQTLKTDRKFIPCRLTVISL